MPMMTISEKISLITGAGQSVGQGIALAIVALCSPGLAYLTGATIPLDGGQANFD